MGIVRFIIGITFVLFSIFLNAQTNTDSLEVHKIDGKEYYIHQVAAGNTLYAISKLYNVSIETLKEENPRLSEALTIGDRLLIPLKEDKKKAEEINLELDGNFLLHEVQKKNTLYSIAKEYHVEINDIVSVNPGIEESGLQKGMKIKIPVEKIKGDSNPAEYIKPAAVNPFVTHTVEAKQTLYALSKLYKVSVDSIIQVNNGLPEGLKEGQLINIPIIKTYQDSTQQELTFDSTAVKDAYQVSLLLPLYLEDFDNDTDTSLKNKDAYFQEFFTKAQYGIGFYQGFKLAVDTMLSQGLNLELRIYDTANDSLKVAEILKDSSLKNSDLIVGPLYLNPFLKAADFAKENHINIVSPVKLSNKILLGNPYVSKVATSEPVRLKKLAQYMADSLKYDNLFMVYPDHFEEKRRIELLQKYFTQSIESQNDTVLVSFPKEVIWDPANFYAVKSRLIANRQNTIIVPSDREAFVAQLLTMLSPLHEDFNIKVVGVEEWQRFDNIEVEYLHHLNVHLIVSEFINYSDSKVKDFESKYKSKYNALPESFAFLGYDVGTYYLGLLREYGANFEIMFLGLQEQLLSRKFEFYKTGIESGYENHSVYLVKYQDYHLIPLH